MQQAAMRIVLIGKATAQRVGHGLQIAMRGVGKGGRARPAPIQAGEVALPVISKIGDGAQRISHYRGQTNGIVGHVYRAVKRRGDADRVAFAVVGDVGDIVEGVFDRHRLVKERFVADAGRAVDGGVVDGEGVAAAVKALVDHLAAGVGGFGRVAVPVAFDGGGQPRRVNRGGDALERAKSVGGGAIFAVGDGGFDGVGTDNWRGIGGRADVGVRHQPHLLGIAGRPGNVARHHGADQSAIGVIGASSGKIALVGLAGHQVALVIAKPFAAAIREGDFDQIASAAVFKAGDAPHRVGDAL